MIVTVRRNNCTCREQWLLQKMIVKKGDISKDAWVMLSFKKLVRRDEYCQNKCKKPVKISKKAQGCYLKVENACQIHLTCILYFNVGYMYSLY